MEFLIPLLVGWSVYSFVRSIYLHGKIGDLEIALNLANMQSDSYKQIALKYKAAYENELRYGGTRRAPTKNSTTKTWKTVFGLPEHGRYELKFVTEKYYDLLKKNHPDVGGSNKRMAEINAAYDEAKKELQ